MKILFFHMGAKDFFKPNLLKTILTIILLLIAIFITAYYSACLCGLCPLGQKMYHPLFSCTCSCIPSGEAQKMAIFDWFPLLIVYLVLAYLISCIFGLIVEKIKSK